MTRDAGTERYVQECIGPRRAAGMVWADDLGVPIQVVAVDLAPADSQLWAVTEVDLNGPQKGLNRNRVISQPQDAAS